MLDRPEVGAFDFARELPSVGKLEPLALYWCLRAFYLEERDVFDAAAPLARKVSPLAKSLADLVEDHWSAPNKSSSMVRTRDKLKASNVALPRKAAWPEGLDRSRLVLG